MSTENPKLPACDNDSAQFMMTQRGATKAESPDVNLPVNPQNLNRLAPA